MVAEHLFPQKVVIKDEYERITFSILRKSELCTQNMTPKIVISEHFKKLRIHSKTYTDKICLKNTTELTEETTKMRE